MYKWLTSIAITIVVQTTLTLGSSAVASAAAASANPPALLSQSAVLMDMNTGQILYAKNPYERLYPASITKIMTALLALEHGHLNDPIRTSVNAANQVPNKVYLVPGEVHSLQQMLYGLLIDSGNDAAVAIAEHYGGTVKGFAAMMNEEAKRLGAVDTHFVNPSGLQNADHYTCAYDMALIARQAMQIPEFRKIVSTKYYLWKGKEWTSYLSNLNEMLWTYPGANGVKTGWTNHAEQTMVVSATRGGHTLLAVLMKVPLQGEMQTDATNLLNYGFSVFKSTTILPAGTKVASISLGSRNATLSLTSPLTAEIAGNDTGKTFTPLSIPSAFTHVPLAQGIESMRANQEKIPINSQKPILSSVVIAPLAYGMTSGAVVGSVSIAFEHMRVTLPVQLDENIPAPVASPVYPPHVPAVSLSAVSLAFAFLARKKQRAKRMRQAPVYPRTIDE